MTSYSCCQFTMLTMRGMDGARDGASVVEKLEEGGGGERQTDRQTDRDTERDEQPVPFGKSERDSDK